MRTIGCVISMVCSFAANAAEPAFSFKPNGFREAYNASARERGTGRSAGAPVCQEKENSCQYRITPVIRATVWGAGSDGRATTVEITFVRSTENVASNTLVSRDTLISYRVYGDIVHLLSPSANLADRGAAIRKLLAAFSTTNKEVVDVANVRYTLDMKKSGVRFDAKPIPSN